MFIFSIFQSNIYWFILCLRLKSFKIETLSIKKKTNYYYFILFSNVLLYHSRGIFFLTKHRLNSLFFSPILPFLDSFWSVVSICCILSSELLWNTENDIKSKGLGNIFYMTFLFVCFCILLICWFLNFTYNLGWWISIWKLFHVTDNL